MVQPIPFKLFIDGVITMHTEYDPLAMDASTSEERVKVVAGTELIAIGTRNYPELTEGKVYKALYGAEEGIFSDRPFVTVIGDDGKKSSMHLSRFVVKDSPNHKYKPLEDA